MQYIYGIHAVKAALQSARFEVKNLYVAEKRNDSRIEELVNLAEQIGISVQKISHKQLQNMLPAEHHHQGVFISCPQIPVYDEDDLSVFCQQLTDNTLFLILDGVQDPHNLGACLRTANIMDVTAVIAPKNRAATLTTAAIKVSSGAAAMTPFIQVTNLARTLRCLQEQGIWIYGADMEATELLWEVDMKRKLALIVGGEGAGLRRLTRQHCDQLIKIPEYGQISSLNVSVAAGICLYEIRRQQTAELVRK